MRRGLWLEAGLQLMQDGEACEVQLACECFCGTSFQDSTHLHNVAGRDTAAKRGTVERSAWFLAIIGHKLRCRCFTSAHACADPSARLLFQTGCSTQAHRPHFRHFSKSTVIDAELESCHSSAWPRCSSSHSWLPSKQGKVLWMRACGLRAAQGLAWFTHGCA